MHLLHSIATKWLCWYSSLCTLTLPSYLEEVQVAGFDTPPPIALPAVHLHLFPLVRQQAKAMDLIDVETFFTAKTLSTVLQCLQWALQESVMRDDKLSRNLSDYASGLFHSVHANNLTQAQMYLDRASALAHTYIEETVKDMRLVRELPRNATVAGQTAEDDAADAQDVQNGRRDALLNPLAMFGHPRTVPLRELPHKTSKVVEAVVVICNGYLKASAERLVVMEALEDGVRTASSKLSDDIMMKTASLFRLGISIQRARLGVLRQVGVVSGGIDIRNVSRPLLDGLLPDLNKIDRLSKCDSQPTRALEAEEASWRSIRKSPRHSTVQTRSDIQGRPREHGAWRIYEMGKMMWKYL